MYKIHNKDEIYFMRNIVAGTSIRIGDKKALIKMVAGMISASEGLPYWKRNEKWDEKRFVRALYQYGYKTDNVFTKQNLTGKDVYYTKSTEKMAIYDNPEDSNDVRYSYTYVYTANMQPHAFHTANDAIFDIRLILNDVKACIISGEFNTWIYDRRHRNFNRRKHHVTYGVPQRFRIRERQNKISCEEQGVKYRNKALPYGGVYYWDESRRSSGWKDKKYKHQWEHNVVNKKTEHQSPARLIERDASLRLELEILDDLLKERVIEECA